MVRAVLIVCGLASTARAQAMEPVAVAPPAPRDPSTPPVPYAPPPSSAPILTPVPAPPPEPAHRELFFIGMGALVGGGGPSDWLYGAYTAELGLTIPRVPIRMRGRLLAVLVGGTVESDWGGNFSRWGAGVEVRSCTRRGGGCLFADLDLGHQKLDLYDHTGDFVRDDKGLFVGPRAGFDAGGAFRFRFAFELYRQLTDGDSFGTFGIALGLGYQR